MAATERIDERDVLQTKANSGDRQQYDPDTGSLDQGDHRDAESQELAEAVAMCVDPDQHPPGKNVLVLGDHRSGDAPKDPVAGQQHPHRQGETATAATRYPSSRRCRSPGRSNHTAITGSG